MPRTVTARFPSEEVAEKMLARIAAEVPLRDSAVLAKGIAGAMTLESMQLAPEERADCDRQLEKGGFLLVAQVANEGRREAVLRLLQGSSERAEARTDIAPRQEAAPPATVDEEHIPIVEEELRIGKREVVRSRSRVRAFVTEVPVKEEVELRHEETQLSRRQVGRPVTEEDIQREGLLQDRVVEVVEMREEAVVTKEAFVREELVVTKTVHRRLEQVEDVVRRTEVEMERLKPE